MTNQINWQKRIKDENPFKVPDGYFDGLESKIMERISQESSVKKSRTIAPMIRWISGVAAALFIGFIGIKQFHFKPQKIQLEQDLMYAVIEYYAQDLDELSLATLMDESGALNQEIPAGDVQLIEYLDVDDLEIIEAIMNGY